MMSLKVLDELGNPVFSVIRIRDPSLSATDVCILVDHDKKSIVLFLIISL